MATRSTIGIVRGYKDTTRIYCHWDGYLEHNGVILQKYYNTADKVEELLKLGNLSCLGPNPVPDKTWESRDYWCCKPYTLRGEAWEQCPAEQREEFNYTFYVEEGLWTVECGVSAEPGDAAKSLGFETLYKNDTKYLIDALSELPDSVWERMKPTNESDWGVSLEDCMNAAREARAPVNKRNAETYEAYYRAYCD